MVASWAVHDKAITPLDGPHLGRRLNYKAHKEVDNRIEDH